MKGNKVRPTVEIMPNIEIELEIKALPKCLILENNKVRI